MFQDLKTILPKSVRRAGIDDKVEEKRALKMFAEAVSDFLNPALAGQVKVLYIKKGIINLACLSKEAAKKIEQNQEEIIEVINKNIGKEIIREARYLT